jgi:hypothetical protein
MNKRVENYCNVSEKTHKKATYPEEQAAFLWLMFECENAGMLKYESG